MDSRAPMWAGTLWNNRRVTDIKTVSDLYSTRCSPSKHLVSPCKHLGSGPKNLGSPFKHMGSPPKTLGSPSKHLVSPFKTLGSPSKQLGSPSKQLGSPSKHLGPPSKHLGSPCIHLASLRWNPLCARLLCPIPPAMPPPTLPFCLTGLRPPWPSTLLMAWGTPSTGTFCGLMNRCCSGFPKVGSSWIALRIALVGDI